MNTTREHIGGLDCHCVTHGTDVRRDIVFLHGYSMRGADLAPFAAALGEPGRFIFPDAPLAAGPDGRCWWPIDQERRRRDLEQGPRDLWAEDPPGRAAARDALHGLLAALPEGPKRELVLAGFSQGGMLAMDYLLHCGPSLRGLLLLSSSRIALADWQPRAHALAGLPVFVSHGRQDADLAFAAGEALHAFVHASGARASWHPFDGGHETPLYVWREIRRFLRTL